ncbi:MAG: Hsp20 family protein [Betaproteobacteria bacterium]
MNGLQVYGPFADAGIDELFRGFFKPVREARDTPALVKVDVTEKSDAFVVHAEIPGVSKEDIHVSIEGNQVTISAEVKRDAEQKDGERLLRSERYYGAVYRSFVLPVELDENTSQAKYEGGVLELTLAKKPQVTGRKLTIQ